MSLERNKLGLLLLALTLVLTLTVTLPLIGDSSEQASDAAVKLCTDSHTATFSMFCYWTGEATLGKVKGVTHSRIGHQGGAEIVQVDFDPEQTDLTELVTALEKQRSIHSIFVADSSQAEEVERLLPDTEIRLVTDRPHFIAPKHSLRTRYPQLLDLGLDESQLIALNSWSYFGGAMPDVLSEAQTRKLRASQAKR